MQSPDRERLDNIAETLAQLLRRQDEFERRLSRLEATSFPGESVASPPPVVQAPARPALPPAAVKEISQPLPPPLPAEDPQPSPKNTGFETKLGLTILNRVGVITLVLGVAFFFKWAVDNNWIGPAGRVILGVLASFAILGVADLLWRKGQQVFAQGITGTGIAVLYLSLYAAFGFYHLIGQTIAFALLLAATCLAVALSLRYNSPAITSLGFFGGYLTPLLLSTGQDRPWFLFSYIFLLDAAAMALARRRAWGVLEIVSFAFTALIYGSWLFDLGIAHHERLVATVALLAFFALYSQISLVIALPIMQLLVAFAVSDIWQENSAGFFTLALVIAAAGLALAEHKGLPALAATAFGGFWFSFAIWSVASDGRATPLSQFLGITVAFLLFAAWQIWRIERESPISTLQRLSILAADGIVYYGAAYLLLHVRYHEYLGLLAVAVAAVYFAFAAYLNRQRTGDPRPMLISLGLAVCFIAIAIPVQFTGFTITVAWSLQAAALTWLGLRFSNTRVIVAASILFGLVVLRLTAFDSWALGPAPAYSLLWNTRFFSFAVAAVALFLSAFWSSKALGQVSIGEYIAGHLVLLWGFTLEIIGWAQRSSPPQSVLSAETVATSILFGIYALVFVGVGVGTRTAINRIAGLCLLAFVILKLYLFDVWQLNRVYRISGFVILGVLLIATSFLYSRFRQLIEGWWKQE